MTTVKHEVSIGFYEVFRVFFLQCVCVCVCGVWRGANVQLAEGGHLWSSPAGKTLQEELLNM